MSERPTMPFGKYEGEYLEDIPSEYLRWCLDHLENMSQFTAEQILTELGARFSGHRDYRSSSYHPPDFSAPGSGYTTYGVDMGNGGSWSASWVQNPQMANRAPIRNPQQRQQNFEEQMRQAHPQEQWQPELPIWEQKARDLELKELKAQLAMETKSRKLWEEKFNKERAAHQQTKRYADFVSMGGLGGLKVPAGLEKSLLQRIIQLGRQQIARLLHGDVTGQSDEQMKKANIACDWLEAVVGREISR